MKICSFAAQQGFHAPGTVRVTITEVVNVTRRARSLRTGGFPRSESDRFRRALKSFSKIRFSFCGHNLPRQRPLESRNAKLNSGVVMSIHVIDEATEHRNGRRVP